MPATKVKVAHNGIGPVRGQFIAVPTVPMVRHKTTDDLTSSLIADLLMIFSKTDLLASTTQAPNRVKSHKRGASSIPLKTLTTTCFMTFIGEPITIDSCLCKPKMIEMSRAPMPAQAAVNRSNSFTSESSRIFSTVLRAFEKPSFPFCWARSTTPTARLVCLSSGSNNCIDEITSARSIHANAQKGGIVAPTSAAAESFAKVPSSGCADASSVAAEAALSSFFLSLPFALLSCCSFSAVSVSCVSCAFFLNASLLCSWERNSAPNLSSESSGSAVRTPSKSP
mmetsp:Transcript_23154/g.65333  ORF Transcript_23154/g.65333 Transcript_23154/m.65333 type:complete len:282 (+) Transcript_23154:523-1368(+)